MMKRVKFKTLEILESVLPKYCRGLTVDLGCGYGKYRSLIEKYADKYIGIDNQTSTVQFNDQYRSKPDISADVCQTTLKNESIDTVICTEVIEHVPDPFLLMAEISRILKSGGYLILSSGWLAPYHQEPKDYWRFSPDGYSVLCEKNGLKIIDCINKGNFWVMVCHIFFRGFDLKHHKLFLKFIRVIYIFYSVAAFFDRRSQTNDPIGHLIVAKKL